MSRRILALAALAFLSLAPAHATGGISCEAEDRAPKFTIGSPIGRSTGGAFFQFEGELEVRAANVAEDFKKVTFGKDHLTQSWFDARDLKMHVHFERAGDGERRVPQPPSHRPRVLLGRRVMLDVRATFCAISAS